MVPPSSKRRLLLLLAALPVLLLSTAWIYRVAMAELEGRPRTFWKALEWASETLTTTGYGADADWQNPAMVLLVISVQFFGVFLVYMLVPWILLPLIEERFELRLPSQAPARLSDHIVIFRYGPAVETLIQELCTAKVPVLIVELDEPTARSALEHTGKAVKGWFGRRQVHVVHDRSIDYCLQGARLPKARAIVANGADSENASAVLIARELGFEGQVLSIVEDPRHQRPLDLAGADSVITPRHVLGDALATGVSMRVQPRVEGLESLGSDLAMTEVRLDAESDLAGKTLSQSDVAKRTGATIVGQWVSGRLNDEMSADTRLEPRGILMALGSPESLDRLARLAGCPKLHGGEGPIVVVGYGEVGRRVVSRLKEAGEETVVVDREPFEGVDVRGDIVDPEILERLQLDRSKALVLALDSDKATLFATLVIKDLAPGLPLVARANSAEHEARIYRAGAELVLSISQVAAQILVRRLLGIEVLALDSRLRLHKQRAAKLVGKRLDDLDIRERTGCSVVAVERDGEMNILPKADLTFRDADEVVVCGHRKATKRFEDAYG